MIKEILKNIIAFVFTKHFLKHLGLIMLFYVSVVLIMMVYLYFYTNHGEKIEVPNFVGMNSEKAKVVIEDLGLEFQIMDSIYDPKLPEGTVKEQSPKSTDFTLLFVKSGRTISLRVSKKTDLIAMPSLIFKQIRFAENILKSRGLRYIIKYRPTSEANGAVLEQLFKGRNVKGGSKIPIGSLITLIVGQNDIGEPIEIPDFYGQSMSEAQYIMDTLGVSYTFICEDCITTEDSLAARIDSQSPEYLEGNTVPKSTPFTLHMTLNFNGDIENPEQ